MSDAGAIAGPTGDIATVESRIAELSGETARPLAAGPQSVAAFQALIDAAALAAAPAPMTGSAPVPTPALERMIAAACAATGEDPALVKAIVANESGFDPRATSNVGAQGLMQLMPATAADVGVRDPYDPAANVAGGTRYLAQLLTRFSGNVPLAIAAYNAGPNAVARNEVPAETQTYVRSVLTSYERYRSDETKH